MQGGRYNGASPWHTWQSFTAWMESIGFSIQAHTLDRVWFRHANGRWFQVPQPVRLKISARFLPRHGDRKNADALLDDRLFVPDDVVFDAVSRAREIANA